MSPSGGHSTGARLSDLKSFRAQCRGHRQGGTCNRELIQVLVAYRKGVPVWHPFDQEDGLSHFLTCPDAEAFGGPSRALDWPMASPPRPDTGQRRLEV